MSKNRIMACTRVSILAFAAFSLSACSVNIPAAMSAAWSAAYASINQNQKENQTVAAPVDSRPRLDMARAAFSAGLYGISIDHLNGELAQRPTSVAALNGLGASYDQLGRYDIARNYYFRALELAPTSSTTLANIGYSYLLQQRHEDAAAVLQLALQYDADNETAATNLLMAQNNILTMTTTALTLQSTILSPALTALPDRIPEIQEQAHFDASLRLEVSNGNGITGLAARLRNYLHDKGLQTPERAVRLTNADNFAHPQSLLYFRPGHRLAAENLLAVLPLQNIVLQETDQLLDSIDLRLLIGRDFSADFLDIVEELNS
jgi:tetratricopeptide (TPR) repeat protein